MAVFSGLITLCILDETGQECKIYSDESVEELLGDRRRRPDSASCIRVCCAPLTSVNRVQPTGSSPQCPESVPPRIGAYSPWQRKRGRLLLSSSPILPSEYHLHSNLLTTASRGDIFIYCTYIASFLSLDPTAIFTVKEGQS